MSTRKTWADQSGIRTGVVGEIIDNITIKEANRATGFEYRRAGIEVLRDIMYKSYRKKGVNAVLFGTPDRDGKNRYAVYVADGFLIDVNEDD